MLKCEIGGGKGKQSFVRFTGDLPNLVGEICYLVHQVHSVLNEQDPEEAKTFQAFLMLAMVSDSPTWQPKQFTEKDAPRVCIIRDEEDGE